MDKKKLLLFATFLLIFIVRIDHISNSPYEYMASWRQGDTESIARNFVEQRFNIFFPQFNYDGPSPNYVQLEFQVTTFIIALLYRIFGYHYELARIVPILFFMGSVYFLYLIGRKYYSFSISLIGIIIYSFLPLTLFYSRAIMPEAAALFFFNGSFYYFDKWVEKERDRTILIASIFTALAILTKVPAIFIGVAQILMALKKFGIRFIYNWQLWVYAAITLLPPYIYFKWLASIAEFQFVNGIATKHIIPHFFTAIFTKKALSFYLTEIPLWFSWYIPLLFLGGFLSLNWKKESSIGYWTIAMLFELVTIVAVIRFKYYLIFITPIIGLLSARALGYIMKNKFGKVIIIPFILFFSITSISNIQQYFQEQDSIMEQATLIQSISKKDDLIVTSNLNPAIINASNRKGWRANLKYYDYIPKNPTEELKYFINNDAKYFIVSKFSPIYGDSNNQYKTLLENSFQVVGQSENYMIYKIDILKSDEVD